MGQIERRSILPVGEIYTFNSGRTAAPTRTSLNGISLPASFVWEMSFPHSMAAESDPFVGYEAI